MTHKRTYLSEKHREIWEAYDRIKDGTPRHPVNVKKAEAGNLIISVSSVSREANCSRTLMGFPGSSYSDVYDEIRKVTVARRDADRTLPNLEHDLGNLKRMLAGRLSTNEIIRTRLQTYFNIHSINGKLTFPYSREVSPSENTLVCTSTKTQTIKLLRHEKSNLQTRIREIDGSSANMIIKIRLYELSGIGIDGKKVRTDTYADRLQALTLVGKHVQKADAT